MKCNPKMKVYGQWLQTNYPGVEIYLHSKSEDESYSFFLYDGKKKKRVVIGKKSDGFFIEQAIAEKKETSTIEKAWGKAYSKHIDANKRNRSVS